MRVDPASRWAGVALSALVLCGAPGVAAAASSDEARPSWSAAKALPDGLLPGLDPWPDDGLALSPATEGPHRRAASEFRPQPSSKKKYKMDLLQFENRFQAGERDMRLKVRVPGKRKTWMRVELEF